MREKYFHYFAAILNIAFICGALIAMSRWQLRVAHEHNDLHAAIQKSNELVEYNKQLHLKHLELLKLEIDKINIKYK